RISYGQAERVIVRGQHHKTQLVEAGYGHVSVIPDGVDLSAIKPIDVDDLRARLNLSDVLTVGVQGNFTWYPDLGGGLGWDLIQAIGRRPDLPIHAVLIGDGPGIAELRQLADKLNVADRVHVVGRVPYPELPKYLSLCDVTLLTQTNDPSSWARTTGKLPTYLASGRHVLASRVGTAADLLPERHLIDYVGQWDHSYPDRLADRLADIMADRPAAEQAAIDLRELSGQFDYDLIAADAAAEVMAIAGAS
ncbi:MAG: glycosyltransferase family 4 protein, partial [Actinobacteria bacterium]|nr:glycosyltransferase family 4 protein [Actinomycetota bacterium]